MLRCVTKRIGKVVTTLGHLVTLVWENPKLTTPTKMAVYNACIVSTLIYGNDTWTTYSKEERKLNTFHMCCLRRILSIQWSDKVPDARVLERAGLSTMFTLLRQRMLPWLCHVCRRMEDGRTPKDILYGELASGRRTCWPPLVRFKYICKRYMNALDINTESCEEAAADRSRWHSVLHKQLMSGEEKILTTANEKRVILDGEKK